MKSQLNRGPLSGLSPYLLLETMAEGVVVLDTSYRIRLWNPAMAEITGYSESEALGQPASWLRDPDCHNAERITGLLDGSADASLDPDGVPCIDGCNCRLLSKSGESVPVLVNARLLNGDGGDLLGILQTVTDFRPVEMLRREVASLQAALTPEEDFHGLVGHSKAMQELYRFLTLAGGSDATVLLLGESGTGKELAASAIHALSERRSAPFVRVNCGALTESLLESELFGHVKGSFTGAYQDRIGRFEAADGGTIFLDEIGDISLAMQVKLLRVLQEGEFERVGEARTRSSDVRVIAATNRDLVREVKEGHFREDLYYRLRVFPVSIPPLRERREDIPPLVAHFIRHFRQRTGRLIEGATPRALRTCVAHDWPGNVRELENAIEYAFVVCSSSEIDIQHLPSEVREGRSLLGESGRTPGGSQSDRTDVSKRESRRIVRDPDRLRDQLDQCDWNKAEVARRLGLSRTAIWKWMKKHGIPLQPESG